MNKTLPRYFIVAAYAHVMRDNNENANMIDLAIYQHNIGSPDKTLSHLNECGEAFRDNVLVKCVEMGEKLERINKCLHWAKHNHMQFRFTNIREDFNEIMYSQNISVTGYENIPGNMMEFTKTLAMEFGQEVANTIVANLIQLPGRKI